MRFKYPAPLFVLIICISLLSALAAQESYVDSTKIKDPKLAWKLGAIPGLGQVYNEKYVKAGILAAAQYYSISQFIKYRDEDRIGKRNTYAWWIIGLWVYGMLDAYVDAQLSTFPAKVENDNPEQPESSSAIKEE